MDIVRRNFRKAVGDENGCADGIAFPEIYGRTEMPNTGRSVAPRVAESNLKAIESSSVAALRAGTATHRRAWTGAEL